MSKLEELIAELCPDGVEYKTLADVTEFIKDGTHASLKSIDVGYPLLSAKDVYDGLVHTPDDCRKITEKDYQDIYKKYKLQIGDVLLTIVGSIGRTAIVDEASLQVAFQRSVGIIRTKSILTPQFLAHLFGTRTVKIQLEKGTSQSAQGGVYLNSLGKITIPIPPMPVQSEVVRILDNFTELTEKLKENLLAELTARKKQYEYYRTKLLTQREDAPKVALKTVVKKSCSGATPTKGNSEYYENGTIPWLRTQDVKFNEIYEINSFITEEAVKKTSAKWIPANCVIVAISGATAGRCAINKIATTTNQHCLNMEIDSTKALYKYIYYCVCSQYEELISRKQGARGDLNSTLIMGIEIPLPPLAEQQRIIDILDRFDTLCNNISAGLTAEIKARKKQYEYYRDKLLTFKELS